MAPLLQRPAYPWRADEATQKPAASSRRVHGRKVRCYARDRSETESSRRAPPRLQGSKTRSAGRGAHAHVVACKCVGRRATRRPFFRRGRGRGRGHRRRARRPGVRGLPESNGSRALAVAPAGGRDVSPFTEGTHVTATGARGRPIAEGGTRCRGADSSFVGFRLRRQPRDETHNTYGRKRPHPNLISQFAGARIFGGYNDVDFG